MTDNWIDSNEFWQNKRVCVTGGGGFLGAVVVDKLRQRGAAEVSAPHKKEYDLVHLDAIKQLLADSKPDWYFFNSGVF